ncbi:MAG: HAD-IC family P-type ATPase, partial [Verrucomicrobium sp.]
MLATQQTDRHRGLSDAEAQTRLDLHGRNELTSKKPAPAWRTFLAQFESGLVMVLLAATAISAGLWVFERKSPLPYEAMTIFAVLLLNASIGYLQSSRAASAVAVLRHMAAARATVIREGRHLEVPSAEIVPGDLILVEEGDTIPADARLTHSTALQTAESALTGESLPVSKDTADCRQDAALGDQLNRIFSGTSVNYGRGQAIVTATGMHTEMGRIAGLLDATPEETTPMQKELDRLGKRLGLTVVIIAVLMIGTILLTERVSGFPALFDVLILGVALAVSAVPEGLPAMVTAVLALGVQRMARRHAIIRHLA